MQDAMRTMQDIINVFLGINRKKFQGSHTVAYNLPHQNIVVLFSHLILIFIRKLFNQSLQGLLLVLSYHAIFHRRISI